MITFAALSACPKNTVIADIVINKLSGFVGENPRACPGVQSVKIYYTGKRYRKISKERYIPMNPEDFYGYRRKIVAVLYERMWLLGVWEE